MPFIAPKTPSPAGFSATLGRAAGKADDFWALAYCPELDELERMLDPEHTAFTYILHYRLPERTLVARYPRRLDGLWQGPDDILLAVGDTDGIVEIRETGIHEIALTDIAGILSAIWGVGDHVFAVGGAPACAYYRRHGQWMELSLPPDAQDILDVVGLSEREVYFVGHRGQVLLFDGRTVTRLRAPVRRHLTSVVRLDDRRVCIGGYQGTLMVGSQTGWRHIVSETTDPLLALAVQRGQVFFGAEGRVWCTDGAAPATPALNVPARWLSGLLDGLVVSADGEARLFIDDTCIDLDVALPASLLASG